MKQSKKLIEEWIIGRGKQEFNVKKFSSKFQAHKLNDMADDIHEKVFEELDCLDCANCCKSLPPIINENDAKKIAKYLGMKITDFKIKYIRYDEDDDMILNKTPCAFLLEDNKCLVYDVQPKSCKEYPHTDNNDFVKNMKLHTINAKFCPAVYHMLEKINQI